jgi:hypothetical protein
LTGFEELIDRHSFELREKTQPALWTTRHGEIVVMVAPPVNHPAITRDWS